MSDDNNSPPSQAQHRGQHLCFRGHSRNSDSSVSDEIELDRKNLFPADRIYVYETTTDSGSTYSYNENETKLIKETSSETDYFDYPNNDECDRNDLRSQSDLFAESYGDNTLVSNSNAWLLPTDDDDNYDGDDAENFDRQYEFYRYYESNPEDDMPESTYEDWCIKYNRL